MAKRPKEFIEVIEEYRRWPYGESTEPYRYMVEKPKPPRKKRTSKTDPYSALTSKSAFKRKDKTYDKYSG